MNKKPTLTPDEWFQWFFSLDRAVAEDTMIALMAASAKGYGLVESCHLVYWTVTGHLDSLLYPNGNPKVH